MSLRIGIDTGGTFTDLVVYDEPDDRLIFHKVPSTPDDPARAIVDGIMQLIDRCGYASRDIELLVHGTTVATNTVLQRAGAKVALITTAGFRDALHIQRQDRPAMYDLRTRRAEPLVPRDLRYELTQRTLFDGTQRTPVDRGELDRVIIELRDHGVEAVAIGFLHSYANPSDEDLVGQVLAESLPEVTVCQSHETVGEHGEYERFSTCVMNAYVQPVMQRYLTRLRQQLESIEIDAPLFVMKSNGGVMSATAGGQHCVETILSGPVGGVMAGQAMARLHTRSNLIAADMGGTSFDVAVIHDGTASYARNSEMSGLPIGVPMLDIHTAGAGGGSIAWVDAGNALRVGPRSAGAAPGPACYLRGGTEPTVTDANLVLGRLAATSLLGGDMRIDLDAARRSIHDRLARPLNLSVEQAAQGVIRVVNATMTGAIRKLTIERGLDLRDFTLCPFGGAGPLHGADIAVEMGIDQTLIPLAPGVTSAVGLLMSNLREDRVRTHVRLLDEHVFAELESLFRELVDQARQRLRFESQQHSVRCVLGMRYAGQRYELPVTFLNESSDYDQVISDFHAVHERMYGYHRPDEPVELTTVWVSVEVDLQVVRLPRSVARSTEPEPRDHRAVLFGGNSYETPVFDRDSFGVGAALRGPAIVEQLDATTAVLPNQMLRVDEYGQIVLGTVPARG